MIHSTSLRSVNNFLLFIILVTVILYFGREILILLMFSIFLAMLMTPASNKFESWGMSRGVSTMLSVLIIVVVISAVVVLIITQITVFTEDLPEIQKKIESFIDKQQEYITKTFGISNEKQIATAKDQIKGSLENAGKFFTGMVKGVVTLVGGFILVLVFMVLFLFKREKYENFFVMLYKTEQRKDVKTVIHKISGIAQQYLVGRAISIVILAFFYTIGLLILGIKNAILLSAIAAIVTFVPYIGPIIGGLLPFLMALVTEGSFGPALGVLAVITLAQAFDNYIIEPLVVGKNVNISPFFTIFILVVGGVIWGIAGVILFLPLLGMLKIIFDNVEGLKPYAYLIGDEKDASRTSNIGEKIKNLFKKKK